MRNYFCICGRKWVWQQSSRSLLILIVECLMIDMALIRSRFIFLFLGSECCWSKHLREGPPQDHPIAPGKNFFLDFIISNERSDATIVKSKISSNFDLSMKNASKNKFKGPILALKTCYLEGVVSILTFSHKWLGRLCSGPEMSTGQDKRVVVSCVFIWNFYINFPL